MESLHRAIAEAEPQAEIRSFTNARALLKAICEEGERPDVLFTDIEMPEISGLALAKKLKDASPETSIVFVTGYSHYAVEAFRLHAAGYILKPVTRERVREELDHLELAEERKTSSDKIEVRCFGSFEMFWKGEALLFPRPKSKELLAYLVDKRGEACSSEELINALWEEAGDPIKMKAYLRTLTSDIRAVLTRIGMPELLIRNHRQWAIRTEMLDCDYYRMLQGDMDALNSYHGEYMSRYSWAEMTAGQLYFNLENHRN